MSDISSNPLDLNLLANFVHQVVNPLNGVAGTLDNLAEGVITDEVRKTQRLKAARAQLEQCITLIRNLAFLAGGTEVAQSDRRKTVLPQIIIEAAMYYQEDGQAKKIGINLSDRSTQNTIYGHPELIRQVLMNIFDNCVKYGKKGHDVRIDQRIQKSTGMAIIEILSTPLFPIEIGDQKKIGTLGFRGRNAKKIVASGSGLGLYICNKILSGHGGSLDIVSRNNGDILFLIKLPVSTSGGD